MVGMTQWGAREGARTILASTSGFLICSTRTDFSHSLDGDTKPVEGLERGLVPARPERTSAASKLTTGTRIPSA
jgi:hypothetical protein